jgi:hypothetical protein
MRHVVRYRQCGIISRGGVNRMAETAETKTFFVTCAARRSYFPGAETMHDVFVQALREPWAEPADLTKRFDIISSSGVLHQLADPAKG